MKSPRRPVQSLEHLSPELQKLITQLAEQVVIRVSGVTGPGPVTRALGESFKSLADSWLATEGKRYVEPKNEERHVRHLQTVWEQTEATLTPKMIRDALLAQLRPNGRLGPNTVNKALSTGKKIVRDAQINGKWGPSNPFALVPRLKETKAQFERVTITDVRAYVPHLRPDRRRMALTILYLGLRPGELIALQKPDVDLARRKMTVRRSRSRNATKTGRVRSFPIPDALVPVLTEAMAASPSLYVFPGVDGGKLRDDTKLSRCLQHAFRLAGLVTG